MESDRESVHAVRFELCLVCKRIALGEGSGRGHHVDWSPLGSASRVTNLAKVMKTAFFSRPGVVYVGMMALL